MRFLLLTALLTTSSTLIAPTSALGINCRGSFICSDGNTSGLVRHFMSAIGSGTAAPIIPGGPISPERIYLPGSTVACKNDGDGDGYCLFLQGEVPATGVSGRTIRDRMADLVYHGCDVCGSVPLSGDNDPEAMGILTLNYVDSTSCVGVCSP